VPLQFPVDPFGCVNRLTVPPDGFRHHLRRPMRNPFQLTKEINMSKQGGSFSMRKVIEQVFAGVLFISMVAFVVGGTIAMFLT
jgi:hypothetical protein